MLSIFFGYASDSQGRVETLRAASEAISKETQVDVVMWQDMLVDGVMVMPRVLEAITNASICIFDLSDVNQNVLFEAGYAIARGKPLWLIYDSTVDTARSRIREFALLEPIGLVPYSNSGDLVSQFLAKDPIATVTPLYDDLIDPALPENATQDSLLYCMTYEQYEAAFQLSRFLDRRRKTGLNVLASDPTESTLETIDWLAPAIAGSAGALIHFAGRQRKRAKIHNRRNAFVAGIASGLEVPVLLLAEEGYQVPFDFRTTLQTYTTGAECVRLAERWLSGIDFEGYKWASPRLAPRNPLSAVRFGQHVAENELQELSDYFVETSAFGDVVETQDSIFVGQRGTGKTANAIQAFEFVASNKTNLAVLIKPPGFEFPALFAVIERLPEFQHQYFFDALWRFVIQTEIAASVLSQITARAKGVPLAENERLFEEYALERAPFDLQSDITTRLEQALDHLIDTAEVGEGTPANTHRNLINEAFHERHLNDLRSHLGSVLKGKKRVAVFVDNLDKGWEKGADFKLVARLILGLLTARGRIVQDFDRQDWWRKKVKLTVSVFLRSDIYRYLRAEAREPDKLPISNIAWSDKETLLAVIESRFVSGGTERRSPKDLWLQHFCPEVDGMPTKQYVVTVVLPRPRDIVYFCNKAVGRAIDRRHVRVEAEDFIAARETYSRYAYEALLVENGVTIPEMQEALFGFLEVRPVLVRSQALECLMNAGFAEERASSILQKLIDISFFGVEVGHNHFLFPDVGSEMDRALALASKLEDRLEAQRLQIHAAYHPFLNVT